MFDYNAVDKKYVIEKLGKGECVICVDFKTMRCYDCESMTIGGIRAYMESTDTRFYTKSEVKNES